MKYKLWIFLLLLAISGGMTLSSGGVIRIQQMLTTAEWQKVPLPFRALELDLDLLGNTTDMRSLSALEYNWDSQEWEYRLREFYFTWFPSFGEITIGRQILAWGMADNNNPTDNLSSYDFNYLFETGVDRKVGSLAAQMITYWGDFMLSAVVIGEHQPNRLVWADQFPMKPSNRPNKSEILQLKDGWEWGGRLQRAFGAGDMACSYFQGFDRQFSKVGWIGSTPVNPDTGGNSENDSTDRYGYRLTRVIGADAVFLWGNWTFRNEAAYFFSRIDKDHFETAEVQTSIFELDAEYGQYVSQIEYTGFSDVTIMGQYIGSCNYVLSASSQQLKDNFRAGLGTPFATIFEQAMMGSVTVTIGDDTLEIRSTVLINLDDPGFMFGIGNEYTPWENWLLELHLTEFQGTSERPENYLFNRLEDFSNITIGMSYCF